MFGFIRGKAGFTMLELIMVIIIIGILATLAIPQYTNFMEKARASEAVNTIGAIKTAESMYKLETAAYTAVVASLDIDVPTSGTVTFWTYALSGASATAFTVTATRTTKKAAAGVSGQTIIMAWNDTTGETWSGTHAGVPK